jgi:PEP-CTERM motif
MTPEQQTKEKMEKMKMQPVSRKCAVFASALGLALSGVAHAQFAGQPYSDGPGVKGLYHLNESVGVVAFDDNSSGRPAQNGIVDGAEWVPALYDNGLAFDWQSSQTLNVGEATRYSNQVQIDFDTRLNYHYASEYGRLFMQNQGYFTRLAVDDSGGPFDGTLVLTFLVRDTDGSYHAVSTSGATNLIMDGNTWMHLTFTINSDGANTVFSIYNNNVLSVSSSFAGNFFKDSGENMNLYFGSIATGGSGAADMVMDEIRVMDVITVPEPSTYALMAIGAIVVVARLRRRTA